MEEKEIIEKEPENTPRKGNAVIWVAVIIVALIVGGYFLLRGSYKSAAPASRSASNSANSMSTSMPPSQNTPAVNGTAVTIKNFAFAPTNLEVAKDSTVTWTNEDSVPHQIASDGGDAVTFSGPSMSQGQSFSFKFDTAGTFPYHCAIHPSMQGTITVK